MHDAIIVGGGLAGLTVARDLIAEDRSVLVLEARDRLGGRTWYRPFAETDYMIELGGTWFAPDLMHFISAEIDRYGLRVNQSPAGSEYRAALAGELFTFDDLPVPVAERDDHDRTLDHIVANAQRIRFGQTLDDPTVADLDVPFTDFLEPMDLPAATYDYFLTWAAFSFGAHPRDLSALHVLSWVAGFDNTPWTLHAAPADKFADGTESLVTAIASEIGSEIQLSSPVVSIHHDSARAHVETSTGTRINARTVVLTTPLNTWRDLEIEPGLSPAKHDAADEGHSGQAVKIWALSTDITPELTALGWGGGLNWLSEQYKLEEGRLLVGIGSSSDMLDPTSASEVQKAIRQFAPEASVISTDGHDWNSDPFAKGAWMAYRPGQASRFHSAFQEPEGRLFLAGSDIAVGWAGFMDGALESGTNTAKQVNAFLERHE